ncbi:DNA glycosylase AlkZ-like family protein [Microbacterium sp. 22303]|uniref:DNA glycosylase AlkZ-like family protein n=1 Tax=Microbacterium sp. 22303 TaxID=3453905 RepID=UPI003F864AB7
MVDRAHRAPRAAGVRSAAATLCGPHGRTHRRDRACGRRGNRPHAPRDRARARRGRARPASSQLTLLLGRLELQLLLTSGVPRDGQHTYALLAERVHSAETVDRDEALANLALRYLGAHGPATDRDLAYWATLTLTDARRGIAAVADRLESFDHDGRTYWHLAGGYGAETTSSRGRGAAHLLQILDEMYRGYQDSRWALDSEGIVLRDREASMGMVLCDGQLVAGMRRSLDKRRAVFALAPYRPLTARERAEIEKAAARCAAFLGVEPVVEFASA